MVRAIDRHQGKSRKELLDALSWDIGNLYWGHINKSNYRRMPVGVYWELLEKNTPFDPLFQKLKKRHSLVTK